MGLFDWFGKAAIPNVPQALWDKTLAALPCLAVLDSEERRALKSLVEAFLGEKEFTTGGDLVLTDEICVSIAAQGCLPILAFGLTAYDDWVGIIVYPGQFVVPRHQTDENGVVHDYDDVLAGEAWPGGPLVISWHDAQMAGAGYNVVIHEFAHKLDMRNGEADGIPAMHSGLDEKAWKSVFFPAYDDFCQRIDRGEDSRIDPYGSEHPAEFFAVLSENFFQQPAVLAREYPALHDLFKRYYQQDPLARQTKTSVI